MIQQIAHKIQAPSNKIKLLLNNRCTQIRTMQPKEALQGLEMNLTYNISSYMGVKPQMISKEQIAEAALFITQKFPMLGLGDIWEAFKMVGAGELDADLTAYYGTFSIIAIGKMLNAYLKYRNTILSKVEDEVERMEAAEREAAEREALNAKARQEVVEAYEIALRGKDQAPIYTHYDQIPSHWAKILFDVGCISALCNGEQNDMKNKARGIAINKLNATIFSDKARQSEKVEARKMLKDAEADVRNEDYVAMWQNIYSKLRVWEYLKPSKK